ncbi:putative protein disulfide-isomerase A6, partial [Sesamum angolense]
LIVMSIRAFAASMGFLDIHPQVVPAGSLEPKKSNLKCCFSPFSLINVLSSGTNVKIVAPPSNVVVLTSDNFDEIVNDEKKNVLVEFYAPWYVQFFFTLFLPMKKLQQHSSWTKMVIANLDADQYKDLAEKHGVSGYPTLKFFPKNNKAGEDYDGGRDLDDFVTFINEKCGTNRDANGQLTSKVYSKVTDIIGFIFVSNSNFAFSLLGRFLEDLNKLVKEFVTAKNEEKKAVLKQLEEEADKLKGPSASCIEKGSDYAKNEVQRLDRMLAKSISASKADEFILKRNILSTFASDH